MTPPSQPIPVRFALKQFSELTSPRPETHCFSEKSPDSQSAAGVAHSAIPAHYKKRLCFFRLVVLWSPLFYLSGIGCLPQRSDSVRDHEPNPQPRRKHEVALVCRKVAGVLLHICVEHSRGRPNPPCRCPSRCRGHAPTRSRQTLANSGRGYPRRCNLDEGKKCSGRFRGRHVAPYRWPRPRSLRAQLHWMHRRLQRLVHSHSRQYRQLRQRHMEAGRLFSKRIQSPLLCRRLF